MKSNLLTLDEKPPKIIKTAEQSSRAQIVSPKIIKNQILSAEEEGSQILKQAKDQAESLIEDAQNKAEEVRSKAYQEGREEAESELVENLLAIKDERLKTFNSVEKELLQLAVKVAEKIIGKELSKSKTVRGEIVLNALRAARQKEMITVRVNSKDLPIVEKLQEKLKPSRFDQTIDFVPDQAVSNGGCIIESSAGTIDARLETQFRILETALLAKVSGEK